MSEIQERNSLTVRRGEKFKIELEANASAGYRWEPVFIDKSLLKLISSAFVPNIRNHVGNAAIQQFKFEAIKEGTTSIKLVYKRVWEEDPTKLNEFSINVL